MRRFLHCVLACFLLAALRPEARAVVTWSFDYSGSAEFNTSATGLARRASLEAAASVVGGWFNHTATVTMQVTSSNENSDVLAGAGSEYPNPGASGFTQMGYVQRRILTGAGNPAGADGSVDCNFFHNWDLDDSVAANAFDFKATMMHELLHAAGFASWIEQNGTIFGTPAGSPAEFSLFDRFLTNAGGTPLVNRTSFALSSSLWNAARTGGGTSANPLPNGVYFSGPNTMAANGGLPVRLYSPNPWEEGSSGSHLDDLFYTTQNLLMEAATDTGPGVRTLSAFEFGILKDIGYSVIAPVPAVTAPTSASVTNTSATLGGNITAGGPITERGVVYALTSANNNPAIGGSGVTKLVASGTATGVFTAAVSGLAAGSSYSFKSYATNSFGTGYASVATFTTTGGTTPAPTVTGISPATGPTTGGTSVTITGTNFTGATGVTIGGNAATSLVVTNSTTLTATTPAGVAGAASVLVTTPGGTNAANTFYTYTSAVTLPTVTAPTSGSLTSSSAVLGGNITAGSGLTERGVVYALTSANANPVIGGFGVTKVAAGGTVTGVFTTPVSGLQGSSAYSFKAYATNAAGTAYSSAATFTTVAATSNTFTGTNYGLLPDPGTRDIFIDVAGLSGVVRDVTVEFTFSPAHPYASDVSVVLISPDQKSHTVCTDNADLAFSNLAGPYAFNDAATTTLFATAAPLGDNEIVPSGTYRTETNATLTSLRASFAGRLPNGRWTLRFTDNFAQDQGTISSARLTLATADAGSAALQRLGSGQMQVNLTQAVPNVIYELQRSTNMQSWSPLQTGTTSAAGAFSFTDTAPPAARAFYRCQPKP